MANVDKGPELAARADSGLSCLVMLARLHNFAVRAEQLQHELAVDGEPFYLSAILLAAKKLRLEARSVRRNSSWLSRLPFSVLAFSADGEFFTLARVDSVANQVLTRDSNFRQVPILRK